MPFSRFNRVAYNKVKKVEYDNHSFASKLEAALYQHLKAMEQNGEIKDIFSQESVYLTDARIQFKPDFSYTDCATGNKTYAESKGFQTAVYRIKRRLWMHYGPGILHVWVGSHKRIKLLETIVPGTTEKDE